MFSFWRCSSPLVIASFLPLTLPLIHFTSPYSFFGFSRLVFLSPPNLTFFLFYCKMLNQRVTSCFTRFHSIPLRFSLEFRWFAFGLTLRKYLHLQLIYCLAFGCTHQSMEFGCHPHNVSFDWACPLPSVAFGCLPSSMPFGCLPTQGGIRLSPPTPQYGIRLSPPTVWHPVVSPHSMACGCLFPTVWHSVVSPPHREAYVFCFPTPTVRHTVVSPP